MRITCGIFRARADAVRAREKLRWQGVSSEQVAMLVPGYDSRRTPAVPLCSDEGPGMGRAMGSVIGAAVGLAGAVGLGSLLRPLDPSVATGQILVAAVILGLAGATLGAKLGSFFEDLYSEGLPLHEWAVYEEALRNGRTVLLTFTEDARKTKSVRRLLAVEGAESVDKARQTWWNGAHKGRREFDATGESQREPVLAENPAAVREDPIAL